MWLEEKTAKNTPYQVMINSKVIKDGVLYLFKEFQYSKRNVFKIFQFKVDK